ncbi:MAG: SigB/SigF/SigG family RNA polymerase sigma factor [Eubacteriales bacterium]|nr:SigB/SigF/SigG family RNA polymerase sigma factor [Eubacteriales bacterium]
MTTKETFQKYAETKDIKLRNKIVEENLYMVDILIRKYLGKGVDRDDLYQVGALALINAVERFDPSKGYEFSSFATPTILGEIKKYFRDKGWSLKVPRRLKEISVALPKAREVLTGKLGRAPTVAEVADYMGKKKEDILMAMESSMAYGAYSLDETFSDSGDEGEASKYEKFTSTEEAGYRGLENREIINSVLNRLSDTNKYIFRERFIKEKSQSDIANNLGVSQMTVSRAERNIKEQLAKELER